MFGCRVKLGIWFNVELQDHVRVGFRCLGCCFEVGV
jgi:hypothetical protein